VFQRKKASARDFFKRDEDDVEVEAEEEAVEEEAVPESQVPEPNVVEEPAASTETSVKPARRRKVA